ncbi:hypothetical protein [Pontibacter cellulosilyticus]|uniref:Uncharacterized protein n=1 Tax=Pontibacter cellulosilyticus TaxID=1720253 RepID=A0A923N7K2_9BACT|nr:hypothetical protein [Pontibacter cellulosilyticus]MBC5991940.1 hypothetical protein [Pontibacter cellulosilyticus]
MRKNLLFGILAISALFSCDKENSPEPMLKVSEFNFRLDTSPKVADYELIVSQRDGKVLLDTLVASHENHKLSVKSADTEFDITTITVDPTTLMNNIKTYAKVNPNNWHINNFGTATTKQREKTRVTYTNLPSYDSNFLFMARELGSWSTSWSGSTLTVDFNRLLPTDQAYLLLPKYGKYILSDVTTAQKSIDFSEAKNTIKTKYNNKPAGITNLRSYLYGYANDGVSTYKMMLFSAFNGPTEEYDLQHPPTGFDLFDFNMQYHDADKNWHIYSFNGISTIPTEINFLGKADFTVNKSAFDDFQIAFEADKPSIYNTWWSSTDANLKASWEVYSSPADNSFNPKALLENLKSKTLAGNSSLAFKLVSVTSQTATDRNHQAFLDYLYNATVRKDNPIRHTRKIYKSF